MEQRRGFETPPSGQVSRGQVWPWIGLCLLVLLAFIPAYSAGFVWDDKTYVRDVLVPEWSMLGRIWFAPDTLKETHYWPLTYTSFWLEHKLWGLNPAGYHLVNVLFHLVNTLLIWRLLKRLALPAAWLIAAVFAVHPVRVEPVLWIIARKDLLSTTCYLTAALLYMGSVKTGRTALWGWSLLCYGFGLLAKSSILTLPAGLLVWHWWKRGQIKASDLVRLLPFVGLGLLSLREFTYHMAREPASFNYSFLERCLLAARSLFFYISKTVWPTKLAVIYPRWETGLGNGVAWLCLLALLAAGFALWLARWQLGRGPFAALLFFAITLLPTLGFVDFTYLNASFVADRYQYLAGLGIIALLINTSAWLTQQLPKLLRLGAKFAAALLLAGLAAVSWQQMAIYSDAFTFWGHIVQVNPAARGASPILTQLLISKERPEDAVAVAQRYSHYWPNDPEAHYNEARTLLTLGRFPQAEDIYEHVLSLNPNHVASLEDLARLHFDQQRYAEAVSVFRRLVGLNPNDANHQMNLGAALYNAGFPAEATRHLERALQLNPELVVARNNLNAIRAAMAASQPSAEP